MVYAARFRAVSAALLSKGADDASKKLAAEDTDQAMTWLKRAVAVGYQDHAQIEKIADFDILRQRDDFKNLIAELKESKK